MHFLFSFIYNIPEENNNYNESRLVYSVQFLMIAVGVGTAVGLNALLSRKIGEHKTEEACQAATTGLFLMLFTSIIFFFADIFQSDTIAFKMSANPEL